MLSLRSLAAGQQRRARPLPTAALQAWYLSIHPDCSEKPLPSGGGGKERGVAVWAVHKYSFMALSTDEQARL